MIHVELVAVGPCEGCRIVHAHITMVIDGDEHELVRDFDTVEEGLKKCLEFINRTKARIH